jgi:hypothetical protein
MLKAPVVILTRGADNKTMFEETQTITVNIHDTMIVSRLKFEARQIITLRNSTTGEEAPCRVVYLSPRQTENREVGIEFMEPRTQFWRISFPPPDWTPKDPEAKGNRNRYNSSIVSKKKQS